MTTDTQTQAMILRGELMQAMLGVLAVDAGTIDQCIADIERFDAVGNIFDPTAWIRGSDQRAATLAMLRSFRRAQKDFNMFIKCQISSVNRDAS